MPRRNISLTTHFDHFVEANIKSGRYGTASEVVGDALRLLEQKAKEDALRLERLRTAAEAGFAAIDRGEFTEMGSEEVGGIVAAIGRRAADRVRGRTE